MTDILTLAASGDAANVMRDLRVRALWSPYYLVKVVLDYKELVPHLHYHDTELFIERWLAGVRKQWIEWPRGFFKSTTFTIGTGIWIVLPHTDDDADYAIERLHIPEEAWFRRMALHDQDATQLLAFETIANAKKKVKEIKWHFEENQLFRELFPEIAYNGSERPWTDECLKIRRIGYGRRLQEGTFEAIGVDGTLQSRHYRIVWEDDLIGKKAVESDVIMASTIRWHGLLHGAFENAAEQIRFGVSNRWGYSDLNSHIRHNEPDFTFYTRAAWEIGADGTEVAIFPERYSLEALRKIQTSGSMTRYDFSCQYLNSPVLPGQQEIALSLLHTYTVESDGRMRCSCGVNFYPSQLLRSIHYDSYNAKGVASHSCPAIACVGTSTDKHVFLLEYFTYKGSYGHVYDKLFELNDRWRPYVFTYEDVGHQNMTEFHIRQMERHSVHLDKHKRFPRIEGISPHNRAWELRVRDFLLPAFARYKFSRQAKHVLFDSQIESFPNTVLDHDYDLLDCLTQGASLPWRFPESDADREVRMQEDDVYLAQLGKSYSHFEVRV